jgi:hypothetical protein
MNEYIINNFLLNIGNSYYKSRDFAKRNAGWRMQVKPTSQFGIGVLSCYMLADKIGIITKHFDNNSSVISFILEGINEHFYYIPTNKIDEERIGSHGSIIKLYLKPEYQNVINDNIINKLELLLMTNSEEIIKEYSSPSIYRNNLFCLICKHIGIETSNIPVFVKDSLGKRNRLITSNTIFDHRNYSDIEDTDVEKLWKEYHYLDGSLNPYKDVIKYRNNIIDYIIEIKSDNIEVYSH